MKIVNTYSAEEYWNGDLHKGTGIRYDLKSERKALRTLLVDVMSLYAWKIRPDDYDHEAVFDIVKKLLESQDIGYGGDMRQHVEVRIHQCIEYLENRTENAASESIAIIENSYCAYLGNITKGDIVLVRLDPSIQSNLALSIVNDMVPKRIRKSENSTTKSRLSVPLFDLLSWIVSSIIDGANVGELFMRPYYTASLCATKRKNSSKYTTSLSKLMFSMLCIIEKSTAINDVITLKFELDSIQPLFPTRIFDEEQTNYDLVFVGNDNTMKAQVIAKYLDIAHERSLRSGESSDLGNRNYRLIRVISGSSIFKIYDVCATSGLERLYCILQEISSGLAGGYILVLTSRQHRDSFEKQIGTCIRRGIPAPKATCIISNETEKNQLKNIHQIRNDPSGYRFLESIRSRENRSSDDSLEIIDHFYFNLMSILGISYSDIDRIPSLGFPEGARNAFELILGNSPGSESRTLGMAVVVSFALQKAEKHMLKKDYETGFQERVSAWIDAFIDKPELS